MTKSVMFYIIACVAFAISMIMSLLIVKVGGGIFVISSIAAMSIGWMLGGIGLGYMLHGE